MHVIERRRIVHATLVVAVMTASLPLAAERKAFIAPQDLDVTTSRETTLVRGQTRAFTIHLNAEQFLQLDIVPHGVAVAIECVGPNGRTFREVKSAYTSEGPLSLFVVAPHSGVYTWGVRATDNGGPSGTIAVRGA